MRILGLIPARGGSKGIPGKNLAILCGKPLIQWTIEAAVESGCFDDIWVSSDDSAILSAAAVMGGVSVIKRPAELAGDSSPVMDTVFHLLGHYSADALFLLQPTNPLRTVKDIRRACQMLKDGAQSVVSYSPVGEFHPYRMRGINSAHVYSWCEEAGMGGDVRRQLLRPCWIRDGSVYLATSEYLDCNKSFEGDSGVRPLIIPRERSVRIDEPFDLEFAEFLLTRQARIVSNTHLTAQ